MPVASINQSDLLMVVHPSVPAKSVQEFIDLAKKEPGKLNYASSGPGTPYHMAGELFKAMSHTDIVHVPHKASGDARNSVISGTVQMMFDAVTTMTALAKGGQVRALATTGAKRNPLTPDLPTVAETVPGYEATIWLGVMAPKGTPKDVVAYLNKHINSVIDNPGGEGGLAEAGRRPAGEDAGGVRRLPAQGYREVGERDQDRQHQGAVGMVRRLLFAVAAVAMAALAGVAVVAAIQHVAATDLAAERRAIVARNTELTRAALAPGSALACLDGAAGETVERCLRGGGVRQPASGRRRSRALRASGCRSSGPPLNCRSRATRR